MELGVQIEDTKQQTMAAIAMLSTLRFGVYLCIAMTLLSMVEKAYLAIVAVFVKVFGQNPYKHYKWEPLKHDDAEVGNTNYPMILVQIPMYNEREVYQLSIGAACGLSWPSNRIIVQVLDDSTDPILKKMVKMQCGRWASKGVNIKYENRKNRKGYKAGAMKAGMEQAYVKECDFVAIFDADFQPQHDFLLKTVPFLLHNPQLALVQARWKFVNSDECLMTRMQEISMDYHFSVEQEVGSSTCAFFGFNGTAGVWRIAAVEEAGGWKDRTTVEDMDLSVRAALHGWKFLYLASVEVESELPSTFKAYRNQQHRWSCGPANLFRKMALDIATNKKLSLWMKVHVIYSFFFMRRVIMHVVTFVLYCVVLPATVFVPQVQMPKWGVIYIPSIITLINVALGTPRSFYLVSIWILFENVMSLHRTKATLNGLLELGRVNEWVVTQKLGSAHKFTSTSKTFNMKRFHILEVAMGSYMMLCGLYGVAFGEKHDYLVLYLFAQAIAFFLMGFGYIGTFLPS